MSKNLKSGNNMSNQEVEEYFINISSYEAKITVEVNSNKNSNKYILNQKYISPNKNSQEVIEPSNIAGVKIIKEDNTVKLENTNLNLTSIFENYDYISDNCLDLSTFISDYKASEKSSCTESENQIILKTQSSNNNKYTKNKTLYIDKETMLPLKMEIRDYNQKRTINIIYNEVKINK
jgi:outer membrane lipoprotein-sorting protein